MTLVQGQHKKQAVPGVPKQKLKYMPRKTKEQEFKEILFSQRVFTFLIIYPELTFKESIICSSKVIAQESITKKYGDAKIQLHDIINNIELCWVN